MRARLRATDENDIVVSTAEDSRRVGKVAVSRDEDEGCGGRIVERE